MEEKSRVYRIRTKVGTDAPNVIQVPLNQTYDMFEILSLKLNQTNTYKTYESDYGIIVGRVIANGGFGIENARVSVFIPVSDDDTIKDKLLYNFTSVSSVDDNGIRYNLLPDYVDDACHQNVGTFPNKRLVLDNDDVIEMFDKYWKYTTKTNKSGDYMLFGIPTGSVQIHCDVDLSDCGILSQRPHDMISKGYNITMFESPNKFKYSTNLNSLAQIVTQDRGVYVYPYWGDVSDGDEKFAITRCDINIEYKFESYAVFIGSIVTDKGSNAIGKNCTSTTTSGKMSDLIAGEGTIEMIRKTIDGKVEEFPIMGNRLIDGDGVWCYAIPMNLDYVTMDEFGNLVPTDNPDKGIATRTRVRFRISLDENPNDASARKRAKYLVPNNPRLGDGSNFDETLEADYEFGSSTREESYCDMFWNKVYTVKNYIPKLQKNNKNNERRHTGIKLINSYGDNNPMPYNSLTIKLYFTYRLICVLTKIFIKLVSLLNNIISILGAIPCWLANIEIPIIKKKPFKKAAMKFVPPCIELSSEFCDDGINPNVYYPGCGKPKIFSCVWTNVTRPKCQKAQRGLPRDEQKKCTNEPGELITCVENELAQQNDVTSFNFNNDWINGVLFAPLWYRKITPKKKYLFGVFSRKAKDEWCSSNKNFNALRLIHGCAVKRTNTMQYKNFDQKDITAYYVKDGGCGDKCQKSLAGVKGMKGVIHSKETMLGQTVYYYRSVEYDKYLPKNTNSNSNKEGEIKLLFATDIVLLGSLNECDDNGVPQFFKTLESTTYRMPTDILFTDHDFVDEFDSNGNYVETEYTETSEMAGCDWGNKNQYGKSDGGLFYDIGCSTIYLKTKSCINLLRLCEYGVSLDETKNVPKMSDLVDDGDNAFEELITDGFISFDELYNLDERSMFATMNGNKLKTKLNNKTGLLEYDFRYLYPHNFDGSLRKTMEDTTKKYNSNVTYRKNYQLEQFSTDYYIFRMGNAPYYYDRDRKFPRYENSFYFYFGLKSGKTAIEKFNSKYFAECGDQGSLQDQFDIKIKANGWCGENDGYIAFDFSNVSAPYDLLINDELKKYELSVNKIKHGKIIIYSTIDEDDSSKFADYERLTDHNGLPIKMLNNGSYKGVITDSNGTISEFTFSINEEYLTFKTETQDFKQPNNVLGTDYMQICRDFDGGAFNDETKQCTRDIGGVITIYNIDANENYSIRIEPLKEIEGYTLIVFDKNTDETILKSKGVHKKQFDDDISYGICVPKGGVTYKVTVNQLCKEEVYVSKDDDEVVITKDVYDKLSDDEKGNYVKTTRYISTKNFVTRKIFVSEPMPFKMFINDVDYDLIKNFNKIDGTTEYSDGWIPKNKIKDKKADLQNNNRNITFANNPWFNINNVWANDKFNNIASVQTIEDEITEENITQIINQINERSYNFKTNYIENEETEGPSVNLGELLNEFTNVSVGGNPKVYYTWSGDYIADDYNSNSFKPNPNEYNLDNIYDLINDLNAFIDKVNDIIILRNNLPSLMQDSFYVTCSNEQKSINVSVQTSDMPGVVTLVHQEEVTLENSDENTLSTNSMVINYEGNIDNVNIPTITYASNENYGVENSATYEPVVAEVKNGRKKYQRHPFYVGVMNYAKKSIPNGLNSKKSNDVFQIDENDALGKLFDFPIIDKVLKVNYISWAYIDEIPYYKKYDSNNNLIRETVTMNGIFAANVFNGNVSSNDEFDTQLFSGLDLKLSNNLIDRQQTYVERRIVLGYKNEEEIQDLFSFTKYYVDKNVTGDEAQYAPVLPIQTVLTLEDSNGCGISDTIFGNMKVELTDESVNNCMTNVKVLEVSASNVGGEEIIYYSAINAENVTYPLNYAESNSETQIVKQINKNIGNVENNNNGIYGVGYEQNIFSYDMSSDYFREGSNKIVDTSFKSQIAEIQDDGTVKYVNKNGYGTTGKFTGGINKPIFVVAETTNHCRALSPVYDFSKVVANVKYGILRRQEVEEKINETTGEKTYNLLDVVKEYKFAISINGGETKQFYLLNYKFTLSGICKIDNVNSVVVNEQEVSSTDKYVFTTISEAIYKMIHRKFDYGYKDEAMVKEFKNATEIIAYDYTGLKHICDIERHSPINTTWYSYIWVVNKPESMENVGIKIDGEYLEYAEDYYEDGTRKSDATIYTPVSDNDNVQWVGWSLNKPLVGSESPITNWDNIIGNSGVKSCRVFYGNWKITE